MQLYMQAQDDWEEFIVLQTIEERICFRLCYFLFRLSFFLVKILTFWTTATTSCWSLVALNFAEFASIEPASSYVADLIWHLLALEPDDDRGNREVAISIKDAKYNGIRVKRTKTVNTSY